MKNTLVSLRTRYMVAAVGWPTCALNHLKVFTSKLLTNGLEVPFRALQKRFGSRLRGRVYGQASGDVLTSTGISAEDQKKYDAVMKKFDEFFKIRRNIILERAKFNQRNQSGGETAEEYIIALYFLVESCEYRADMVKEMLRDRLVVGMRDVALSERLQLDSELTLEKAKRVLRQKEAVKEQNLQLQSGIGSQVSPLNAIKSAFPATEKGLRPDRGHDNSGRSRRPQTYTHDRATLGKTEEPKCTCCGKGKHPTVATCPAASAICHRCNRKGHYESQCYSKTKVSTDELTVDIAFLGAVSGNTTLHGRCLLW